MSTVRFSAGPLVFEWDEAKAASNRVKHGVSFEEAATVFADPLARVSDDPDVAGGEHRFVLMGVSSVRRAVVVVHVDRHEVLRIISARLATRRERAILEQE